jgi:hypothetical protein
MVERLRRPGSFSDHPADHQALNGRVMQPCYQKNRVCKGKSRKPARNQQ